MVGITSNDKVLLGNCIDSESNKNNWRRVFPKHYRRELIKVTWKFSKINKSVMIDTQDENLDSFSSNVSLNMIRESTEVK